MRGSSWEQEYLVRLQAALIVNFNQGELRALCGRLRVDFDRLPGDIRAAKAEALVWRLDRRGRISQLVTAAKQMRPDVDWGKPPRPMPSAASPAKGRLPERSGEAANCRSTLVSYFNRGELRALSSLLGVEFDELAGEVRADKAKALVAYLEQPNRIPELIRVGVRMRPDLSWDGSPHAAQGTSQGRSILPGAPRHAKGLRGFLSSRSNGVGLVIVALFLCVAVAAPLLARPEDPDHPSDSKFIEGITQIDPLPPSREVLLGTVAHFAELNGARTLMHFDIFYSLVWGTRSVLRFGLLTALSAAALGVFVGLVSGYIGGVVNTVVMRLTDSFLAFPVIAGVWLFRVIMMTAGLELVDYANFTSAAVPETLFQRLVLALEVDPVMLSLILFSWMAYARIINANVMALKQTEFTIAAKSLGAGNWRIIFRHLLPNAITPAIVLVARDIGGMVIMQAAFAFVGVSGTVDSTAIPEWSRLLMLGRHWIIGQGGNPLTYWWMYLPVTLSLVLFGAGWNLLGDGINAALNPREG